MSIITSHSICLCIIGALHGGSSGNRRNSSRPFPRLSTDLSQLTHFCHFFCVYVFGELCAARFCVLVFCLRSRCSPIMPFSLAWLSGRNVISIVISYERLLAVTLKLKQLEMWLSILILISKQVRLIFQAHGILKIQSH